MSSLLACTKAYLKEVSLCVFAMKPAGRYLTVLPDDIFLVSYMRSGSTWCRFLFGNLVQQEEPVTFINLNRIVPTIESYPDRILRRLPRILKSHEPFDPRYPRVIYLVRDPRDIAVSLYYYSQKIRILPNDYSMDIFVRRYIDDTILPLWNRRGSWEDHVLSWIRLRQGRSTFCLIRYEDLLSDPVAQLSKAARILRIEPAPERIERAINLSSASNMRSLEQVQWKKWKVSKHTRADIPFVREASSGFWRNHLSEFAVRNIEQAWGETMHELGYQLDFA